MNRKLSMQRTAKAFAAAAAAAAPLTMPAAPAQAMGTTKYIVEANDTLPIPLLAYFASGYYDYTVQYEEGNGAVAQVEFAGDWMKVNGVGEGTAVFTVTGTRAGAPSVSMTFAVDVLQPNADGGIDIGNIVEYMRSMPEHVFTKSEVQHLLYQTGASDAFNEPPVPAGDFYRFLPAGPIPTSIDLESVFVDFEGDAISYTIEHAGDWAAYPDKIDLVGSTLTLSMPYSEVDSSSHKWLQVTATDANGASYSHDFFFKVYNKYAVWHPEAYTPEVTFASASLYDLFETGDSEEIVYHVTLPTDLAGILSYTVDAGTGELLLHSNAADADALPPSIPVQVTAVKTTDEGYEYVEKAEFVFVKNTDVPISHYHGDGEAPYDVVFQLDQDNEPVDLAALFEDDEMELYGETLSYNTEPYGSIDSYFVVDQGKLSFDLTGWQADYGSWAPYDTTVVVRGVDAAGNEAFAYIDFDFNSPPLPVSDGTLVLSADDYLGSIAIFEDDDYYDEDANPIVFENFEPSGAEGMLGITTFASGSIYMSIASAPTETTSFTAKYTDPHGRMAEVDVKIVAAEEQALYYDEDATALVDLDALFEEPEDEEYSYVRTAVSMSNSGAYISIVNSDNVMALGDLANGGTFTVAAYGENGDLAKSIRFTGYSNGIASPWFDDELSVVGDVYGASLNLSGILPEETAEGYTYEYYYYTESSDLVLENAMISVPYVDIRYPYSMPYGESFTLLQVEIAPDLTRKYRAETIRLGPMPV
ncbi:hypothetical protein [Paenibacillus sp.]|uniref:hypothetical protein n=1 Tax=Paenibacillus sp. TaxID=58172 RepID=UPI002D6F4083|nr:hypothetical protein [Paenibacillus sp.]HZG57968.1 hypothetical protein [Paenibacillus sp.]